MSHSTDENQILLSLSDFKQIFKQWKGTIIKGALLCALLASLLALFQPIRYITEATFYEKAKSDSVNNTSKNAALLLLGEERESSAIVMLKSQKIIEEAIKKLDLQATVEPYSLFPRLVTKVLKRLSFPMKNLSIEWALLTRNLYPLNLDKKGDLEAKNIFYEGEVPRYFDVKFTSQNAFTVIDQQQGILGEGLLGTPFDQGGVRFTLQASRPLDLNQQRYEVILMPVRRMAEVIASSLNVVSDYKDKSFITLTLSYNTRRGTADLLNAIMEAYRNYLIDEHHRIVASQVDYLKKRREMMESQLALLMQEHAEQLSTHAGNLDVLVATQQNLQKKLLTTDLEIKHIQQALDEGSYVDAHYISENDPPFVHQTASQIRGFRQHSSSIQLALNDLNKLELPRQNISEEFQGIDLETANTLYISYCRQLQEAEASAIQNQYLIDKIRLPEFELSSLASVLTDPVSGEIVKKAGTLTLAIKDQSNRTQRELERLNQDLELQRNFLTSHLQQIVDLLKLRVGLLYSKIKAVQEASLDLLQQKIALHEQQLLDYATSRLNTLHQERALIQQQKQALQHEFNKLPEQWASQKLVDLYLKTDGSLMQHIGSLIESKNIADHLEISLSAPFDLGKIPLHPKSPHLFIFAILGAIMGAFGVACFALMQSVLQGIKVTVENLRLAGAQVAGTISEEALWEGDWETLRHLIAYLCPADENRADGEKGRSLLILESRGPSYAEHVATLLSKRQLKVLLMEISFEQSKKGNGLLSYLEGDAEEPKVIEKENFDFLPAGGFSPYGAELIESVAFRQLLQKMMLKYDWILAVSKASPKSAEAEGSLALFDRAAITLTEEKLHELTDFLKFNKPLMFILSDSLAKI